MQIGFNVPTSGPLIEPDSLIKIVTEGEALGFDYVTVSDHIMTRARELRDALDADRRRAVTRNLGAAGIQANRKVADFRFARGILKDGFAISQNCRQHRVLGRAD